MAILADAVHDLGDSLSLGLSWFLENYSKKEADQKFSFGYARFSLLGALINSMILIGGSLLILSHSIPRILEPESVNPTGMLYFAIGGILVNGLAALKLMSGKSINEEVVSWHLVEDILGWVGVLIVSIVLIFKEIPILDPLLSILISSYILYNIIGRLKSILTLFLQGVPENISISKIENLIIKETVAKSVHHTHIWSLEGKKNLLSTHIVIRDNTQSEQIIKLKNQIKDLLTEEDIEHITIEVEYESEECSSIYHNNH